MSSNLLLMQDKDSNSPAAAVFVDVDQLQETSYVTRNDNNTPSTDNKSENQSIVSVQDDVFTSKNSKPQKPLAEAVKEDDMNTVDEWILYLKANPTEKDTIDKVHHNYNALHIAIINNSVSLLEKLVDEAKADLKHCTSEEVENPPLVLAAFMLCESLFREETTAQPNTDDTDGCLKSEAETKHHKTTFHALLHWKVDVNSSNRDKITALHVACNRGNMVMVKELLEIPEIKVDQKDKHGNTPVHAACVGGNKDVVESLIEHGADFKLKNVHEMLPLHVAVVENHLEVVEMILTNDRLVEHKEHFLQEKDKDGHSAFLLAVKAGEETMVRALLGAGLVTITDGNLGKVNAFHLAAAVNKEEIMQMIWRPDSEGLLNEKDSKGCTPLHYAAKHDQPNALTFLIERSDSIEQKDSDKMTPLLAAVTSSNLKATQILIGKGADVTVTGQHNKNVIHFAVDHGAVELLKILLDHDVAMKLINGRDDQGMTPLHKACILGHCKIVEELLKKGTKKRMRDNHDLVPLHHAICEGHLEIVKLLVNSHADIDAAIEKNGWTPLAVAAANGQERIVDFFLKSGADIHREFLLNKEEGWKATPLLIASYYGHVRVIELLIEKGAAVKLGVDHDFSNCLVIAIKRNHKSAARAIIESKSWKDAMRWRSETDDYGKQTPMKLLITNMPDVARVVMDKCMIIKKGNKFEFLDDTKESVSGTDKTNAQNEPDAKKRKGFRNWVPQLFKKEAHALHIMVESEHIELLNHKLATELLDKKWKESRSWYFISMSIYLVFLSFLTAFALSSPTPRSDECITTAVQNCSLLANSSCTASDNDDCQENYNQSFLRGAAVIIILFSLIYICVELYQLRKSCLAHFTKLDNCVEICLFTCSIIFVSYGLQSGCQCPKSWQWQFGAFTLLLAWLELLLYLKTTLPTGVYVLMFIDILWTFAKMFLLSTVFVISFGLTFYMIFFQPGMRSAFSSPARSLIKTMVMTTGELDFDGIFFNSQEDAEEGNNLFYPHIAYFLWIVFIVLMPIVLTNLLIGLAVDDIKGIQDKADLKRLKIKVEFSLHVQEIFFTEEIPGKIYSKVIDYQKDSNRSNNQTVDSFLQNAKNYDDSLKDDTYALTTTEQIKEEVSQLKAMIKDLRENAESNQNKNLSKSEAMITDTSQAAKVEQLTGEVSELKAVVVEQNTKILQYLKQISSNQDDVLMEADPAMEEVHSKSADDGKSTKRRDNTLDSSHPSGTSSSNSNVDK